MAGWRRHVEHPGELSQGRYRRLPLALLAYAAGFLILVLDQFAGGILPIPAALVLTLIGAAGAAELILGVGRGPLKHALHGALYLIAHPRPARFHDGGGRDSGAAALRPRRGKAGRGNARSISPGTVCSASRPASNAVAARRFALLTPPNSRSTRKS